MKKQYWLLIPLALIALFLLFGTKESGLETFTASRLPVSFQYPKGYVVIESDPLITIMLASDKASLDRGEREGGEGPPAITIRKIDNPNNPGALAWAKLYPQQSSFNLRTSEITEARVSGFPAIRYSADGLYPSRNVVVETPEWLYYVNGQYLSQDSPLYRDFEAILASLTVE